MREPGTWITLVVMIDPAAGAGASRPAAGRLRIRVPAMLAGVALVAAAPDRGPGAWLAVVGAVGFGVLIAERPPWPVWSRRANALEKAERAVVIALGILLIALAPRGWSFVVVFILMLGVIAVAILGDSDNGDAQTLLDHSGTCVVTLEACGEPVQAIKALREVGLDFRAAKALVDGVPAVVAADLTTESADLVAQALRSAGGRVAVREG
jgi:ribosomal protein L7/L12